MNNLKKYVLAMLAVGSMQSLNCAQVDAVVLAMTPGQRAELRNVVNVRKEYQLALQKVAARKYSADSSGQAESATRLIDNVVTAAPMTQVLDLDAKLAEVRDRVADINIRATFLFMLTAAGVSLTSTSHKQLIWSFSLILLGPLQALCYPLVEGVAYRQVFKQPKTAK